jgi:hypothetical protein
MQVRIKTMVRAVVERSSMLPALVEPIQMDWDDQSRIVSRSLNVLRRPIRIRGELVNCWYLTDLLYSS